jgi:hypothetical protein
VSYLDDYSKLNEGTEIPGLFAVWSGISSISCVLGRHIWIDMGTYTIFPNLYVILVASSGRCRKSTAISVAKRLLRMVEPPINILPQKTSPSALIRDMKRVNISDENEFLKEACEGFVLADELTTFLNNKTYDELAATLIQFYDCESKFEYSTRERGIETLHDTCLGLLGGTTMDWLKMAIPIEAIGSGVASRINFIYVPQAPAPVAITSYTNEQRHLQSKLVRYLQDLVSLNGLVQLSKDAWAFYEEEYNRFYHTNKLYDDAATSGYASRRGVHLLKLAIIFALSERQKLSIEKRHIEQAKALLEISERFLPMLLNIIMANETGLLLDTVYNCIKQEKTADRKSILAKVSNRIDSKRLSDFLETLIQSGRIKCYATGKDIYYEVIT